MYCMSGIVANTSKPEYSKHVNRCRVLQSHQHQLFSVHSRIVFELYATNNDLSTKDVAYLGGNSARMDDMVANGINESFTFNWFGGYAKGSGSIKFSWLRSDDDDKKL